MDARLVLLRSDRPLWVGASEQVDELLRLLLWRILGLIAFVCAIALVAWLLRGGVGAALRTGATPPRRVLPQSGLGLRGVAAGQSAASQRGAVSPDEVASQHGVVLRPGAASQHGAFPFRLTLGALAMALGSTLVGLWTWTPVAGLAVTQALLAAFVASAAAIGATRAWARRRRRYVRLRVEAYRTDIASVSAVTSMFAALHKRILRRWWRRLLFGQPSVALEVHHSRGEAWLALTCPEGAHQMIEAALRSAYPNCRLREERRRPGAQEAVLRLKKQAEFIERAKRPELLEHRHAPSMNHLMTAMAACGADSCVQVAVTPAPVTFERYAKHLYRRREERLSRRRRERVLVEDRSLVEDEELRAGLEVQHRPLFFVDLRVIACGRGQCERIASELRAAQAAENRLVERGTAIRHGLLGLYGRRIQRGEGNPLPSWRRGVFASTELAAVWQLPSVDYATVPFARGVRPVAPAPSAIWRPIGGPGTLRDALGGVSIHPEMRKQNTAVSGTVEQGKSSYLVATVAEDLRRERCAVIVLDPKGDAAEAAVALVPPERTCTLLDLAHPTCGFNPLDVDAPADVIADYVVSALRQLFDEADIRASSDRYLRNAIIAVLAYDRCATLWDAARLLSVGEEGYAYRGRVAARLRELPELSEISTFFASELTAQLADSRSTTTAKLDAPVNKLARLLNSQSIKRVLLNDSLRVDLDRVIAAEEVLVVKGALGAMGAGNTSVLMQLLVGMLDAALARQQDLVPSSRRVTVALKIDEAPLVLNRGFAQTLALKRSAGLETVACWQTEAQWTEREVRDQLDALFAHRVHFATASASDARAGVELTMAEFSDTVRPGIENLSTLGRPDARLHLPRYHAIASWTTPAGRQPPFLAQTIPLRVDRMRVAFHCARQAKRGGAYRSDLRQPHWEDKRSRVRDQRPDDRVGDRRDGSCVVASQSAADTSAQGASAKTNAVLEADLRGHPRTTPGALRSDPASLPELSARAAPSYRELVELDKAHNVRWAKSRSVPQPLEPEPLDLAILALVACMGHLLSSQIHARFNAGRSITTTQRRLKRLSDAGLVRRFQFHRGDGGGAPMCYALAPAGRQLLLDHADADALRMGPAAVTPDFLTAVSAEPTARVSASKPRVQLLERARRDVRVAGWALAFERSCNGKRLRLRGAGESALSPPLRSTATGPVALGPGSISLPGGRVPHEFMHSAGARARVPVERFETVRPDMTIELSGMSAESPLGLRAATRPGHGGRAVGDERSWGRFDRAVDLLVELDRSAAADSARRLERYDHFLSGWSVHTKRYDGRLGIVPVVVLVCRDRARARERTRMADEILTACRAYPGEYPSDWEYVGREAILFVAERDMHEGVPCGYGTPRLPPAVRASLTGGDPRSRAAALEVRDLAVSG